jgi:nucleotide-binding universal stress UspA family protein
MMHKILVAIHGSDRETQFVFQEALDLAKASGASLKLLHVLPIDDKETPNILTIINTPENKKLWDEFEKPGLELLQKLTAEAITAGVPTEYYRELGKPGHVICETARLWQADLIVVGRRGLAGVSELLLGSVSNYVTHYAPCSVLVVQQPSRNNGRKVHHQTVATSR